MPSPIDPSDNARLLRELHDRSGLSWEALGRQLGTGGEFVRKVAAGAKPGRNLTTAIGELMSTGTVTSRAERRTAATGELARVRGRTGEPSRIPPTAFPRAGERIIYKGDAGRLSWAQKMGGLDQGDVLSAIASAGRGHHRVSFRVWRGGRWVTVGSKGGYDPRRAAAGIRKLGLAQWLANQSGHYGGGEIGDVEVIAE